MQSRDVVNKIYEDAVRVRQHTVLQETFSISIKSTLKNYKGII